MALADIIGASLIAGMLILMMIGLTSSVTETSTQQTLDVVAQESMTTIIRMIEYDFHKMGYQSIAGSAIVNMSSDSITFWSGIDTDGDGISDGLNTITYQLSDTSTASSTPNPNDKFLYRTVGAATPVAVGLGVTDFGLEYFDEAGNVTANTADVKAIGVSLDVQSTVDYDGEYSSAGWETMISPRNL
ncbi:hypothetical protein J7M28_00705 [bacterium]|nr:hypothetical protein [bacterium]